MSKRKIGRPTKYTAKRVRIILDMVRRGAPYGAAARAAGISQPTLSKWLRSKPAFAAAIAQAAAEAAIENLTSVDAALIEQWRSFINALERKLPEGYGRAGAPDGEYVRIIDLAED